MPKPGLKVEQTGDWPKARKATSSAWSELRRVKIQGIKQEGEFLRQLVVDGIKGQSPGGRRLQKVSRLTIAARALRGRSSSKALIDTGSLMRSVTVKTSAGGQRVFVGILRQARGRDGRGLADIAAMHEFGSSPIQIRITPKMQRFLGLLIRRAGRTDVGKRGGGGRGTVVIRIPERPFLRPAFEVWQRKLPERFRQRMLKLAPHLAGRL